MIAQGAIGQKAGRGVYFRDGKITKVLDLKLADYRVSAGQIAPEVDAILKVKDPTERLRQLRASAHPQAQLLWSILRDIFHYCAVHLGDVANFRARYRPGDALGLRLEPRPVRALAGGRLA